MQQAIQPDISDSSLADPLLTGNWNLPIYLLPAVVAAPDCRQLRTAPAAPSSLSILPSLSLSPPPPPHTHLRLHLRQVLTARRPPGCRLLRPARRCTLGRKSTAVSRVRSSHQPVAVSGQTSASAVSRRQRQRSAAVSGRLLHCHHSSVPSAAAAQSRQLLCNSTHRQPPRSAPDQCSGLSLARGTSC